MAKGYDTGIIILCYVIKTVLVLYGIYFICVSVFNLTLKETTGEITSIYQYEKTSYMPGKGGGELKIKMDIIYYKYNIDGENYSANRIYNLLIYPKLNLETHQSAPVYYSALFPQYSLLFKGNAEYAFYNVLPLGILGYVLYKIMKKYDLFKKKDSPQEDS